MGQNLPVLNTQASTNYLTYKFMNYENVKCMEQEAGLLIRNPIIIFISF
jgi:hypothetical protein